MCKLNFHRFANLQHMHKWRFKLSWLSH